jgi:hypothetical protein
MATYRRGRSFQLSQNQRYETWYRGKPVAADVSVVAGLLVRQRRMRVCGVDAGWEPEPCANAG